MLRPLVYFYVFFWRCQESLLMNLFYKCTGESRNAACIRCNPGPQVCTLLCNWTRDSRTFHLAFIVYYDPCIVFKIEKHPIFSSIWLSLSNYNGWMDFFLSSGLPFLTVTITMSPTPAAGSLFSRPLIPFTEMIYKFLAPVLSAQLITAPTGRPRDIRNFAPEDPPRPRFDILNARKESKRLCFFF